MRIALTLTLVLLVINALVSDYFLFRIWQKPSNPQIVTQTQYIETTPTSVPVLALTPTPTSSPKTVPTIAILTPGKKIKTTSTIPIPGSGSTIENKWTNIPGTEFTIDTRDYPGMQEAYLEVNMKLFNGNGQAFVRLFDMSAGIEVWGSEVATNSQSFTAVTSGKITLRPGVHVYRIQAKSLTADTTVYNSGRIKIISEN